MTILRGLLVGLLIASGCRTVTPPRTVSAPLRPEVRDAVAEDVDGTLRAIRGDLYAGAGGSLLPNAGISLSGGRVLRRAPTLTLSLDARGVFQFFDEKDLADDGNPGAGEWLQLELGAKISTNPGGVRHSIYRLGAVWLDAAGIPNIVDLPGNYVGAFVSGGFEVDVTPSLSVGPELTALLVSGQGQSEFIPQVGWHLIWWPHAPRGEERLVPVGEFYGGVQLVAGPNVGGGIELGQVFLRTDRVIWSFEIAASIQSVSDRLLGEGDGDWGQVRASAKALLAPGERGHWTVRAGGIWLRSTAPVKFLDMAADHAGLAFGIGYELDVTDRLRTGPELAWFLVTREGSQTSDTVEHAQQLTWRLLYLF